MGTVVSEVLVEAVLTVEETVLLVDVVNVMVSDAVVEVTVEDVTVVDVEVAEVTVELAVSVVDVSVKRAFPTETDVMCIPALLN